LACSYCYQTGRLKAGRVMQPETLNRILSEIQRVSLGPVSLLWFGGEPTLVGLDKFRQAVEMAEARMAPRPVRHSLQTNAVLIDDRWAALLAKHRFGVTLSLDGPAELHDARRVNHSGRGSHAAVMAALKALTGQGIQPRASCVVDEHTLPHPEALVDYFAELGLHEVDFPPSMRVHAGQLDVRVGAEEHGRFMARVLDRWLALGRPDFRIRSLAGLVRRMAHRDPGFCKLEGDCSGYVTFAFDGDVYPCDEFSVFPEMRLGSVLHQPLDEILDGPEAKRLFASWSALPRECLDCRWLDLCRGGCPFERAMAGGVDRPSVLCEGLKILYGRMEEALAPA
ncbi:MAG: radical SAM protein, partial [Candidatus Eremiobacterota bacterium]